jgi:hypothetical protein
VKTAVIVYLGIGVLVLLAVLVQHVRKRQPRSSLAEAVADALHPERRSWHQRLLHAVIVPALTGLLVLLVWPAALFFWRQQVRDDAKLREFAAAPPRQFAVRKADLRERLSLAEAEARERVHDPLHAVPDLPFGHLNPAWKALCAEWHSGIHGEGEEHEVADELWSFSTIWEDESERREERAGYVIVRAGEPRRFILTTMKALEDPEITTAPGTVTHTPGTPIRLGDDEEVVIPDFLRKDAD